MADGGIDALDHLGEAGPVEDAGCAVADLLHDQPDAAGVLVGALFAAHVGGMADAGERGQGTVDDPDHLAERDEGRLAGEEVAPALPLLALEHPVFLEFQEDELQELLGDTLGLGDIRDEDGLSGGLPAQHQKGLERVLCFFR